MSDEDIQKVRQAFEELIVKAIWPILKNLEVSIVRMLNDKKACKCLHIWLHTKNRRIKKKQSKRINKILLSYMPL